MSADTQNTVRELVNRFYANHPTVWHRYMNDATYHAQVELMIFTLSATIDQMTTHGIDADVTFCVIKDTVDYMLTPPKVDPATVIPVTPVTTLAAMVHVIPQEMTP